ncbi:MAG: branched-chain amino acid transport system permease protein [Acidimicrobiaceae bacterium]|nr:branched-chain amino acid transport system permease protein [Acidimicrobiaceae bacterium]
MAQQISNALVLGAIYILFTLGLSLAFGVVKILNLAHGAIFMFSAFGGYIITREVVLPLAVVLPLTIVIGAALAVTIDFLAFRAIRKRIPNARQAELSMLIASVGATSILVAIAREQLNNETRNIPQKVFKVSVIRIGDIIRITNLQLVIFVLGIIFTVAIGYLVQGTKTGRALRGLAYDPPTCALLGINANVLTTVTMAISGGLAGAAGVLLALNLNVVDAEMGDPFLLKAFAIIILGGAGSVPGAVLGGFVLAFAETMTAAYLSTSYRDAIAFGLILVILLLRPEGLLARKGFERA